MMTIPELTQSQEIRAAIRVFFIFAAGLLIAGLLPAECRGQNQIEIFETRSADGYDPFTFHGPESYRLLSLYAAALVELDASGNPENRLAESIERGKQVWTIRLLPNTYFADGYLYPQGSVSYEPLTARDVEATYRAFVDPRTEVGDPAFRELLKLSVLDIKAVDDRVVSVQFKKDRSPEVKSAALEFPIVPAKLLIAGFVTRRKDPTTGEESRIIRNPYGAGYYFRETQSRPQVAELSRNEKLPDSTKAQIAKISLIYQKNYESDINNIIAGNYLLPICMPDVPVEKIGQLSTAADHRLIPLTKNRYNYVAFNCSNPILNDRRVRQALSCSIDRNRLLGSYQYQGDTITGPFPSDSPYRCDTCKTPYQGYNPDLANDLLQQAGWVQQPSGRRVRRSGDQEQKLAIRLATFSESGSVPAMVADRIKGFWEDVGVTVTVNYLPLQQYNQRVFEDKDFDAAFGMWSFFLGASPRPTFYTKAVCNFINYSNPGVDALLDSIPELGTDEAILLYHRLHQIIADDAPYAFLYTINRYALLNAKINVGPNLEPFNFFRRVNKWYIQ